MDHLHSIAPYLTVQGGALVVTVHRVMHFTAVCQNAQLLSKLMTITKLHHAAWCAGNVLEVGSLEDLRAAGKGGLDPNGGPCTVTRIVMKMATLKPCMNDPWVCDDPCMPTDISNYAVSCVKREA